QRARQRRAGPDGWRRVRRAPARVHAGDGRGYLAPPARGRARRSLFHRRRRVGPPEWLRTAPGLGRGGAVLAPPRRGPVPAARCSIGVAEWDRLSGSEQLLAWADEALYEAKEQGRGRAVVLPAPSRHHTGSGPVA